MRIAIACEDQAHRALATSLIDRVLLSEAGRRGAAHWVDEPSLAFLRSFCGLEDTDNTPEHLRFYDLKRANEDVVKLGQRPLVGGQRLRLTGHIHGKPLQPEAAFWRRVLILFAAAQPRPDALIVVRDTDGDLRRLAGLKQALEVSGWPLPILVAAPHQDAEAWFVAGFVPLSDPERQRFGAIKGKLSFDPSEEPHRLTARPNDAPTDAKRVLRVLVFDENESRSPSLEELPELGARTLSDLALLERRGQHCGLRDFLDDLRRQLVPLLIPGPAAARP